MPRGPFYEPKRGKKFLNPIFFCLNGFNFGMLVQFRVLTNKIQDFLKFHVQGYPYGCPEGHFIDPKGPKITNPEFFARLASNLVSPI